MSREKTAPGGARRHVGGNRAILHAPIWAMPPYRDKSAGQVLRDITR
jgi:hypothetical protein